MARIFQVKGSVFPQALAIALPCSLVSGCFKYMLLTGFLDRIEEPDSAILNNSGAWSGIGFLVGFLIVFRTSQAYTRFWDGCIFTHQMRAEWFDACSAICSFCAASKADRSSVVRFKHLMVRLFSMLHAAALADIEDCSREHVEDVGAFSLPLIDVHLVDADTLRAVKTSDSRPELIFSWIQQLLAVNIDSGVLSIPPPILSRAFQELSNGMVAHHQAMKIATIPFPFPYAQTCECILMMHWIVAPLVVAQWATHPGWAGFFTFIQVFVLWSLNFIAVEIENPFGKDDNDLDFGHMQDELNKHLLLLVGKQANTLPRLVSAMEAETRGQSSTFVGAWMALNDDCVRPSRRSGSRMVPGSLSSGLDCESASRPHDQTWSDHVRPLELREEYEGLDQVDLHTAAVVGRDDDVDARGPEFVTLVAKAETSGTSLRSTVTNGARCEEPDHPVTQGRSPGCRARAGLPDSSLRISPLGHSSCDVLCSHGISESDTVTPDVGADAHQANRVPMHASRPSSGQWPLFPVLPSCRNCCAAHDSEHPDSKPTAATSVTL